MNNRRFQKIFKQRNIQIGLFFYLSLLPILGIVPYWFSTNPNFSSAAAVQGYNNSMAHLMVVLWSFLWVGLFFFFERSGYLSTENITNGQTFMNSSGSKSFYFKEIFIVFMISIALYFPPFLARYGPYVEDSMFLTILHRMHGGQEPYKDFESLYGPLMLYIPYFWTKLFGYSMSSYYSLIALMEAVQYSILLAILQRYYSNFWVRIGIFLLLSAFLFDTLLGLSWNGLRKLLPVLIIILLSNKPNAKIIVAASLLLGIELAYSHDFGITCLVAILAIYCLKVVRKESLTNVFRAIFVIVFSLIVWFLCTIFLLGDGFSSYIEASLHAVNRYSGEGGFAFYWTINSLATFGLLCLTIIIVGRGLGKTVKSQIESGDLLLFGGLAYALVGLKSGLNRADVWHLASPMMVLIFAFVLPVPKKLFAYSYRVHILSMFLIIIMAVTYFLALFPTGSFYANGLVRGFLDSIMLKNSERNKDIITRAPTIELERSYPSTYILELAEYLAAPERITRPVLFYSRLWGLDKMLGVYKTTYPTDDFLLSDQDGYQVRDFLKKREDTLVIMDSQIYRNIFDVMDYSQNEELMKKYMDRRHRNTPMKNVLKWLSTIHYSNLEIENREKEKRWERTVGYYIRSHYHKIEEFNNLVVLDRLEMWEMKKRK